ncbi:MAG: type II secretion system F family protein [Clostridiales bacterium]|nr:type II secretion system F family protein [Clostridiales bacterium]
MQQYKYTAVNLAKEKFTGTFIAKDEKDLAEQLAKQDLFLVNCVPYTGETPNSFFTLGTGKVKRSELTTFCRQFSIMINSGIPILGCLDILKNQAYSGYFKKLLAIIDEDVKAGIMLSDALNKHKKVFPEFFRSMIFVGEASGKLEIVFNSLADYYETDSAIKRKVKSALAYPITLLIMTIGIVILMLTVVIPTFRESLSSLEITPTGITKVVYDFSDFMLANWRIMILLAFALFGIFFLIGRFEKGKYFYDFLKLKLPLIGKVQTALLSSRFARGFGLLLSSGMDITDAMDTIEVVLGNRYMRKQFRAAAEDVRHGMPLAMAFEKYKLFPPILIQMVAVGEKTAALDDILMRSCKFFDEQVETTLTSLTAKIQPIMMCIMGGVIGTMFIAVYSPMLAIMGGLG